MYINMSFSATFCVLHRKITIAGKKVTRFIVLVVPKGARGEGGSQASQMSLNLKQKPSQMSQITSNQSGECLPVDKMSILHDHNYQNPNSANINEKRPVYKKRLTLAEKFQVLKDFKNRMKNKQIAEKYQVHHSTISRILSNKKKLLKRKKNILKYNTNEESKKYSKNVHESLFEKSIYIWFTQKRALGEPVSGPLLRSVALEFHKRFHGETSFSASEGWLEKFRKRHGIHLNVTKGQKGEKLSAGDEDTTMFRTALKNFIEKDGYELDNIYNADESSLFWKQMPNETFVSRHETEAPGRIVPKDRVTIQVCSNVTGSHKIPLTIIGKSLQPQSLRNTSIPVIYMSQKKSLMDRKIFINWYTNIFLPSVKERNPRPDAKFLLILDNAPAHLSREQVNAIDPQCSIYYLSPIVTSLIQPMNQGVISSLKRRYKSSFLYELVAQNFDDEESVANFVKKWTLGDCCYLLANAWSDVSTDILKDAWKNLLHPHLAGPVEKSSLLTRFPQLMKLIPGYDLLTLNEVENWVEKDGLEPPWKPYSSEKIAKLAENSDEDISNDDSEEELQNSDDDDEDEDMNLNEFLVLQWNSEIPNPAEEQEDPTEHSPAAIDELLRHVLRVRHWSRKNNQTTVEENCALETLKERLLCIKLDM